MRPVTLPIDALLPEVLNALRISNTLILQASPGSGKTTRVPPSLLKELSGQILVLEPRRLAARLSAERVAAELESVCGTTVGYQIRFENKSTAKTRIKFITEGIFLRIFLSNSSLEGVSCVILDEFHERHIHTDVALALLRHLQLTKRPDLKVVLMSATLDTSRLEQFLPGSQVLSWEAPTYPVAVEYMKAFVKKSWDDSIYDAVSELLNDDRCPGHILCFLTGAAEIRRAARILKPLADKTSSVVLELRADLPLSDTQKVFSELGKRKIILSTNVAETSVTIDGVTGVVDPGFAKVAGFAAWSGLPTLDTKPISQASSLQRAGRAGRTAAGVAKRLFSEQEFFSRSPFEKPEIQRLDFSQMLLELKQALYTLGQGSGLSDPKQLPWYELPQESGYDSAEQLLMLLGSLDKCSNVTPIGHQMSRYPLHPRLSRVVIEGFQQGCPGVGIVAAALLSEGMILRRNLDEAFDWADSDVGYQARLWCGVLKGEKLAHQKLESLDMGAVKRVEGLARMLCGLGGIAFEECLKGVEHEKLSLCLLAGFPDRVAQVRRKVVGKTSDRMELNLCLGGGAVLSKASCVHDSEFLLALEAEETTRGVNAAEAALVRVASGIEPEILSYGAADLLKEAREFYWDGNSHRVRAAERTYYGKLIIEEKPFPGPSSEFENLLRIQLKASWPKPFEDATPVEYLSIRQRILKENGFELSLPDFQGEDFEFLLAHICEDKKSFSEIRERELDDYILDLLSDDARRLLSELAPERILIGAGRKVVVHYEDGKPPWIASRLQDFFGTVKTPKIAKGRMSLVVHLLAPNGRAVQVTNDLEGFWERAYPEVRKELSRKYPRHSWPEDPKSAPPPEPRGRRRD